MDLPVVPEPFALQLIMLIAHKPPTVSKGEMRNKTQNTINDWKQPSTKAKEKIVQLWKLTISALTTKK